VEIHRETLLNIDLEIKERKDCKIGTVCVGILVGGEEGERRRLRRGYMVDGLHIPI
jgi:hypothetical protein